MNIPDAAIEAAAEALTKVPQQGQYVVDPWTDAARAAIEAAMPAIREALADEAERAVLNLQHDLAHTAERLMAVLDVKHQIIDIVRGGTP